ncbi:MAG: cytidylyltransferase domain-containing protein [Anaerolineales bacterium]|jgi:CMP-N-acetylneuraminic acid synthetase
MTEIVALVPMRHHSQRVKGKNFRNLAGVPLFYYIIKTLQDCSEISQIVVDTDSEPVMDGLRKDFPEVTILERPQALRADDMSMNEVLIFDTSQVEADFYIQTHSTNPLLKKETISKAINTFITNFPAYDSLFSVTRIQTRLWDETGAAINHNPAVLLQTQDLAPVFEENSCLYIFKRNTLLKNRNRLGDRPLMFEIAASEAWDIDEILDFDIVEYLMNKEKLG